MVVYMNYTFKSANSNVPKDFKDQASEMGKYLGGEAAQFLYETPYKTIAALVAGAVLMVIFPPLGNVCLGMAAGSILSRVVVKIIDKYNPEYLLELKQQVIETNEKYPYLEPISLIFAAGVALISPSGGVAIALGYGAFKGVLIQVELYELNQKLFEANYRRRK